MTAVELPKPLDDRTNDLSVGASWANPQGMFRLGWDGSWFTNHFDSLVWDNPIRITDFSNGLRAAERSLRPERLQQRQRPGAGTACAAPNNMMNVVSATGLYKLPSRTTLNGTVQFTSQTQDEASDPMDDQLGDQLAHRVRGLPAPRAAPARDGAGGGERHQHAHQPQLAAGSLCEFHGAISL